MTDHTDTNHANKVFQAFSNLPDPRTGNRTGHNLYDIIIIAILAFICGADHWTEVELFGKERKEWLQTFLELPEGIPSHDTFGRVFSLLNPEEFERSFLTWVQDIEELTQGTVVAVDGKTLRGSHDRLHNRKAIHMVSAWSSQNGLVLGLQKVDEKSNEITAIPKLLETLILKGCIVTIDAMGCQKDIVRKIREQEADYVIAVKGNQPTLHEDIQLFFEDAKRIDFAEVEHTHYKRVEKGHGRIEIRRYWLSPMVIALRPGHEWQDLRSVGMVESERQVDGKISIERRYYITSLSQEVEKFAQAVREHWGIENGQHWVLDIAFREDEQRIRLNNAAENAAVLRRMALNLLKQDKTVKLGIKSKRKLCGWNNDYLLQILSPPSPNF
jgi:predicted transposase YbfD/YdcC